MTGDAKQAPFVDADTRLGAVVEGNALVLAFIKYLMFPAGAMCTLLAFVVWLDGWDLLLFPEDRDPYATVISVSFWTGLAAAPGYLRGFWIIARSEEAGAAQSVWVVASALAGFAVSLIGGVMSLFTIVFGFVGLAAAGSSLLLLWDFLRGQWRRERRPSAR